jgi:hypothetical protein
MLIVEALVVARLGGGAWLPSFSHPPLARPTEVAFSGLLVV